MARSVDDLLVALENKKEKLNLVRTLTRIRQHVTEWPKHKDNVEKLRQKGSFKKLVGLLESSNKTIVDLSLSIIGNCCMDRQSCKDFVSNFCLLRQLEQTLERYSEDEAVHARVFRIVGNLCRVNAGHLTVLSISYIIMEKHPKMVPQMVTYLESCLESDPQVSANTISLGIRALRMLLSPKTVQTLVTKNEILNVIGCLLNKNSTSWCENKTKDDEIILNELLKFLMELSRHQHYPSIMKLKQNAKGDALACLSKILLLAPKVIVKIVMNFLRIGQLQSDIPISGLFEGFIEVLRGYCGNKEFDSTWEDCLRCLCMLFDEPSSRCNTKCVEGIGLMISVLSKLTLENENQIECCILIVKTLDKCRYHQQLVEEQLKCNFVDVLLEKAKGVIGSVTHLNVKHKETSNRSERVTRRVYEEELVKDTITSQFLWKNLEEYSFNVELSGNEEESRYPFPEIVLDPRSPVFGSDSDLCMSSASGMSPASSLISSWRTGVSSDSDSDDYSPVCSEADPTEFLDEFERADDNVQVDPSGSDLSFNLEEDDESGYVEDNSDESRVRLILLVEIVRLLRNYLDLKGRLLSNIIMQMGSSDLLKVLIKTTGYFSWPGSVVIRNVLLILSKVTSAQENLMPLVQTDLIPDVFTLSTIQHSAECSKCRLFKYISKVMIIKLMQVAESGPGKGELAHKLLRGHCSTKQHIVSIIPYIVQNKSILFKLMMNCGGLGLLMKQLEDQNSEFHVRSIKSLNVLASARLAIANPVDSYMSMHPKVRFPVKWPEACDPVCFKLDDGSVVNADRDLLCRNSDFFSSLLNGGFRESSEKEIALHDVTSKAFKCLLYLMERTFDKTELTEFDVNLETHLELITLSDKYLMPDHCIYLTTSVEKLRLDAKSIPKIYRWSLESKTNFLRVECVAFALVAKLPDNERIKMFHHLFDLDCKGELLDDIKSLVTRYVTIDLVDEDVDVQPRRGRKRHLSCQ